MLPIKIIMNGLEYGLSPMAITDEQYQALADKSGDMLFESCTLEELESTYLYGKPIAMMEAITSTGRRIERTMRAFHKALSVPFSGTEIEASEAEISKPKVSGGYATMTARFALSDGQSIGVIFHSPSGDPARITGDDVLVAFRFVLNRTDVTTTVAPAGGADISLKQVTLKLANLAERNSDKFQKTQAKNQAKKDELETLQKQVELNETELSQITVEADKAEETSAAITTEIATYQMVTKKAAERVKNLKAKLAALSKNKVAEPEGDNVVAPPAPNGSLTPQESTELAQFIKSIDKDAATYEAIINGDPKWAGFDAKAISMSINNRVKTLHKNKKLAVVDGILAHIAQVNATLTKPMFTNRHSIWKLGTVNPNDAPAETGKPTTPSKPEQDKATGETLALVDYAMLSGDLQDSPKGAVAVVDSGTMSAQQRDLLARNDIGSAVGILSFTSKLTSADVSRYRLFELISDAPEPEALADSQDDSFIVSGVNFKTEVSNLIGTHFGKTWHEIGLEDPQALLRIVSDSSQFGPRKMRALIAKANNYIVENKISVAEFVYGKSDLHWYGLKNRPASIGAMPKAQHVVTLTTSEAAAKFPVLRNNKAINYGAVAYQAPLSDEDVNGFELVDISKAITQALGLTLTDDDMSYFLADLANVVLDRFGESSTSLGYDTLNSLMDSFSNTGGWFNQALTKTYTFQNRKEDIDRYKQLQRFKEVVTDEQVREELELYVKDAPSVKAVDSIAASDLIDTTKQQLQELEAAGYTIPVALGEINITSPFSDNTSHEINDIDDIDRIIADLHSEYVNTHRYNRLRTMLTRLEYQTIDDLMDKGGERSSIVTNEIAMGKAKDGQDYKEAVSLGGHVNVGSVKHDFTVTVTDVNLPVFTLTTGGDEITAQSLKDLIEKLKMHHGLTDYVEQLDTTTLEGGDNPATNRDANDIKSELERALESETDSEALLDVLEAAIDDLEALGAYDEHEALVEKVSDRITELLSMEDIG